MDGGFLDGLDGLAVGLRKILHHTEQIGARPGRQRLKLREAGIAQGDKPGNLDLHTPVHIAQLAGQGAQGIELAGVASVQRGNGGYRGESHRQIVGFSPV